MKRDLTIRVAKKKALISFAVGSASLFLHMQNVGFLKRRLMYFEIIVVSVLSFFIVFDCNNVKSHIVKGKCVATKARNASKYSI